MHVFPRAASRSSAQEMSLRKKPLLRTTQLVRFFNEFRRGPFQGWAIVCGGDELQVSVASSFRNCSGSGPGSSSLKFCQVRLRLAHRSWFVFIFRLVFRIGQASD